MKHDLKSMSRKELEKLGADVAKALKRIEGREMKTALAAAEKAAKAYGFTLSEITSAATSVKSSRTKAKLSKRPSAAKYANPTDASQTWSGKGRQPQWYKVAISTGKLPADLAI